MGRPRSFMQRVQKLCYAYDPESRQYVLKLNRIILAVTLLFAAGFVIVLLRTSGKRRQAEPPGLNERGPS